VNGSKAIVLSRSVVWSGQNNSILRLAIWEDEHSINRGPGSFDRTTRVTWYREFEGDNEGMVFFTNKMQPWLSVDKAGDPVGFGTSHAFKTLVGGYVENQQDKLFNFPITAIDYTNGEPEDMLLKVPLNTSVPLPETNISSTGNSHHTYGPYYMGITGLEADGNRLTIVIGEAGSAFGLVFDLNESK
jgi:hypothetical protein